MPQPTKQNQTNAEAVPFPEEAAHLADTANKLAEELIHAEAAVSKLDEDYIRMQRYLVQHRNNIDPREIFQGEQTLRQIDRSGVFVVEMRDRLLKLQSSPYFARIDFQAAEEAAPSPYYIGRFSFTYGKAEQLIVYDWRAPVCSMFYDYNHLGPAGYAAPKGEIAGVLTKKRQFKITNGQLEYALESAQNVQDEVLARELAQTADDRMKTIIATIQQEQNKIIREGSKKTLIIQGAAGSGKTSIALHRVAFLLYRFKKQLTAKNVTIISPNAVFSDYISGVLPELGEEPIYEVSLSDIAQVHLDGVINFEAEKNLLEEPNAAYAERAKYKSTPGFLAQLDRFIVGLKPLCFCAADFRHEGFFVPASFIEARMSAYPKYSLLKRISQTAEDVYDRLYSTNIRGDKLPTQRFIQVRLKRMLAYTSTLSLYKEFYKQQHLQGMFVPAGKNTLEWGDVFPFLYLHHAFVGLQQSEVIRHLVVDEMQDYTPVQYGVINALFPCPKTILGDFAQAINPVSSHTLSDLCDLYPGAQPVVLSTSYRSSYEIIEFAKKIQPAVTVEPVKRHGEGPTVIGFGTEAQWLAALLGQIKAFGESGYNTMGILTKTNKAAAALYGALQSAAGEGALPLHFITPSSTGFSGGIVVTSIAMSKGLEFDSVMIADADSKTYCTDYDRNLLYVACTRAMHALSLLYVGNKSPLIG